MAPPVPQEEASFVFITHDTLSLDDMVKRVGDTGCGAVTTFLGTTRDNFNGKEVVRLEYEAYEPMALKEMKKICDRVLTDSRFSGVRRIACAHRLGLVPQGESSVVIAVGSEHRPEGFDACRFLIDELKAVVPIWKKEIYADGSSWKANKEWVPPGQPQEANADAASP
eukprot:TRINITY_DN65915_c0_g1_i1.p1 TRINITY_DN65915_c0_g1~~TRINITY_DN65915_c0_g1_i1.p1  ORF type:complete len:168 (-),score=30.46 TRINITY_DN65915_c0_g1_i1:273-776(-)